MFPPTSFKWLSIDLHKFTFQFASPTMRLKAARSRALFTLLLAVNAHHSTQASTCTTLLDSNSTLAKSLSSWDSDLPAFDYATIFQEIDTALPWMSKCAASVDPHAVYTSLASNSAVKSYFSTMENLDVDLSTNDGWSTMCTTLEKTFTPFVGNITEIVMDALGSTSGCCDDFLDKIKTLFGDSLDTFVVKLMKLGGNIECSERTFTSLAGTKTKEMCGYSISNSFTPFHESSSSSSLSSSSSSLSSSSSSLSSTSDTSAILINLAQIPNDQMCKAFEGKAFTNTKGESVTFAFGTKGIDTMGICLDPIDTLFQYMKSWELFSATVDAGDTKITLSDLFESGKSIRGDLLVAYATTPTNLPMMVMRTVFNIFGSLMQGGGTHDASQESESFNGSGSNDPLNAYNNIAASVYIHIPNNGNCTYSNQTITQPYEDVTTANTTSPNVASVTFSGIITGVALVSTLVLSFL
ncbi:hypothetical protein PHMEG_00027309 [Phytophthora megakarya]|uniref:Uncharacterized protein n=1 Tax=Phytophthora megakarya TaxID=4795 RepID=A0A225V8W5_9STRA|nr:hypothetical protein PHMEG_00027309 [Phytophthora megakarya]